MGPGFLFWLVAKMNSGEEIGNELCEAVSGSNPSAVRYYLTSKAPGMPSERWTTESIEKKLDEISESTGGKTPVNIWVCGTPSMN